MFENTIRVRNNFPSVDDKQAIKAIISTSLSDLVEGTKFLPESNYFYWKKHKLGRKVTVESLKDLVETYVSVEDLNLFEERDSVIYITIDETSWNIVDVNGEGIQLNNVFVTWEEMAKLQCEHDLVLKQTAFRYNVDEFLEEMRNSATNTSYVTIVNTLIEEADNSTYYINDSNFNEWKEEVIGKVGLLKHFSNEYTESPFYTLEISNSDSIVLESKTDFSRERFNFRYCLEDLKEKYERFVNEKVSKLRLLQGVQ